MFAFSWIYIIDRNQNCDFLVSGIILHFTQKEIIKQNSNIILILQLCSELKEYARKLGIDIETEKHLLYIAREGLLAELPSGWKPW